MRRILQLSVVCIAAGVVSACTPDEVVPTENIPTAGVRFINAVPDTMGMDFRFVDQVESNAHFRITFRNAPTTAGTGPLGVTASTTIQYKNARAGSARHFRVFLNDTIQATASTVIKDSTLNLEAGKNYTVMLWGYARTGSTPAMKLDVWEDAPTDPAAQVALRVINATGAAIDVRAYPSSGTAPATATWAGVAALSRSTYINFAPDTIRFNVRPAGGAAGTELFADARALFGAAATADIDAVPGTTVAGSAVTLIVFPGSVTGSPAAQFSTGTGSTRLMATATGFAGPRSFINDGFIVGQTITPAGFSAANNANAVITAVVNGATTGNLPNSTGSTGTLSATLTGYTRSAGSFLTNGFAVGEVVTVSGFTTAANNGECTIGAGLTATVMPCTKSTATVVEAGTVTGTFAASPVGYSRTTGDFVADGFMIGHSISASGFTTAANNGTSVITNVTPTDLTVTKTGGNVAEAAAAGRTIRTTNSRSIVAFGRIDVTGGRTAQAAAGSRSLTVTPRPAGPSFTWDRRPPRTCAPLC
jgi:hypothetical protein